MAVDLYQTTQARRVTVVTPLTRIDLALPAQATVAEVVLQVVTLAGAEDTDHDTPPQGWLLSRPGGEALEPARSVASADISDGDILYLSPRSAQLPPVLFDDVVEAIAEATSRRADRWTPLTTRRSSISAALATALAGLAFLATAGPQWAAPTAVAAALAAVFLASAAALSRAAGDATAGAAAAVAALPYAAWAAARAASPGPGLLPSGAPALLLCGGAVCLVAVLGVLAVGDRAPAFGAVAVVAAVAVAAAAAVPVLGAPGRSVAATVVVVVTLALPAFPMLSVRLARLPLPIVPVDMDEFRRDEAPTPGDEMVELARRADAVLTALFAAFVALVTAAAVVLVAAGGRWPLALVAAIVTVLLLRGRQLLGRTQRLLLLVPGVLGALAVLAAVLAGADTLWRLAAGPGAAVVGAALVGYAATVPRRGAAPYVARLLDAVEFVALASLLPLAGAVLGAYAWMRGIGG